MSVSLDFEIDNEITPADLIRLALAYWKIIYPEHVLPEQRVCSYGMIVASTRVEIEDLDCWLAALQNCPMGREIRLESCGIDSKISLSAIIGREYDDTPYGHLFLYLLDHLAGDALINYNGERPLLLRRSGIILLEQDSDYFTREPFRSLLPPPVTEGKIPW